MLCLDSFHKAFVPIQGDGQQSKQFGTYFCDLSALASARIKMSEAGDLELVLEINMQRLAAYLEQSLRVG